MCQNNGGALEKTYYGFSDTHAFDPLWGVHRISTKVQSPAVGGGHRVHTVYGRLAMGYAPTDWFWEGNG